MDKPDFIDINHTSLSLNKGGNYTCPVSASLSSNLANIEVNKVKINERKCNRGGWYDEENDDKKEKNENKSSYFKFIKTKTQTNDTDKDIFKAASSLSNNSVNKQNKNEGSKFKFIKKKPGNCESANTYNTNNTLSENEDKIKEANLFEDLFSNTSNTETCNETHNITDNKNIKTVIDYSFIGAKDESYLASLHQNKIQEELNSLYQNKNSNIKNTEKAYNPLNDFLSSPYTFGNQPAYTVNNYNVYNNFNTQYQYQIHQPIQTNSLQNQNTQNISSTTTSHKYTSKKEDVLKDKFDFVSDMLKSKNK